MVAALSIVVHDDAAVASQTDTRVLPADCLRCRLAPKTLQTACLCAGGLRPGQMDLTRHDRLPKPACRGRPRPFVLIITGAPASGKTTLGCQLAASLHLPFLSKDLFKETLFDSLGWQDRDWSRRIGGASMALLFRVAGALLEADQSVALESNFYVGGETSQLRELGERYACQFIQVVCTAPSEILVERFVLRARSGQRHPGHVSEASFDEVLPRLLSERWEALELPGPAFTVDTAAGQVDVPVLVRRIAAVTERR